MNRFHPTPLALAVMSLLAERRQLLYKSFQDL